MYTQYKTFFLNSFILLLSLVNLFQQISNQLQAPLATPAPTPIPAVSSESTTWTSPTDNTFPNLRWSCTTWTTDSHSLFFPTLIDNPACLGPLTMMPQYQQLATRENNAHLPNTQWSDNKTKQNKRWEWRDSSQLNHGKHASDRCFPSPSFLCLAKNH